MSKQEIYAWTSILSSVSILIIYGLYAFGLPENWSEVESQLSSLFFKIFLFVLIVEVVIGILKNKHEVDKDERDERIAGKGFRNAYLFLSVAIISVLFQLMIEELIGFESFIYGTVSLVHILVYIVLISSIVNRGTQIYFYRKM
ncbi:hypothetical protein [Rhodohalobacter mucosus]|uniref:Uncharacterized protein n=1 Tax=Rhodohalobacter mucosus TaxID=2079485 RepID=A0A316TRY7_9BACT|nr:hypothetical protein [Rhodohalobacter mucosus]PWN07393.1 hypothetical protein DDZ15_03770 [Rhodohalobacter mucosus]